MRIFPKVLAIAATALALGVAAPASAHWDRWHHNHHRWEPPRHHHYHNHHGWHRPHYAPSHGHSYVPARPYYGGRW